jgi:CHAT domain-containing protein
VKLPHRAIGTALVFLAWITLLLSASAYGSSPTAGIIDQIEATRVEARSALDAGDLAEAYRLAAKSAALGADKLGLLHKANIESYLLISDIAGRLGQPAMSIVYAENAYSAAEAMHAPKDPIMGTVLRVMGDAYGRAGDYSTAEDFIQAAIVIHEEVLGKASPEIATDLISLIKLYLHGDNPLALKSIPKNLKRAKDIRIAAFGEDSLEVGDVWLLYGETIAATLSDTADYGPHSKAEVLAAGEKALNMAEKALAKHYDRHARAFLPLYRARGDLYMKAGRYKDAFDAYAQAVQAGGEIPVAGDALRMAVLAALQHDADLTVAACNAANSISYAEFREFSRWAGITDKLTYRRRVNPMQRMCLSLIYGLDIKPREKSRALMNIELKWRAAASRAERERYKLLRHPQSNLALTDVSELGKQRQSLARILLDIIRTGRSETEEIGNVLDDLGRYEEVLALDNLTAASGANVPVVTAQDLAKHLSSDSAIVMYTRIDHFDLLHHTWSGQGHYVALILRPNGAVDLVDLGNSKEVETTVIRELQKFRSTGGLDYKPQLEIMSELYNLLWKPVSGLLTPFSSIYTITEGPVSLVPLAALRDGAGKFLVESKQITYLMSPLDLIANRGSSTKANLNALLIGDPDFGTAQGKQLKNKTLLFERLKGGQDELDAIRTEIDGKPKILMDGQATEAEVRRWENARFVHFATHGFFLDDTAVQPLRTINKNLYEKGYSPINQDIDMVRSGLALAGANISNAKDNDDGILTALEIAGMDFSHSELVTLSACDTGMGITHADEGIFGLRLAFQLAGAKNVIMSLWPVHSQELIRQMKILYKLIQTGCSPSAALHRMQNERIRWYRKHINGAPPWVWAAFIAQAYGPVIQSCPGTIQ